MEGNVVLQGLGVLLLVGLPALAARDVEPDQIGLEDAAQFRRAVYISIALSLLLVAGLTWAVATWQEVAPADLGWETVEAVEAILWSFGATAVGLGLAWAATLGGRRAGLSEGELARLLMPRDAGEKRTFLLVAGVGAVCEEYIFRGFLLHGIEAWTGNPWIAVAVTSVSFGFAHGYQRAAGVLRATLLGIVLAIPVVQTGSLFPAIVAHFWINAVIGLWGWRWLLPEEGGRDGTNGEDGSGPGPGEVDRTAREPDDSGRPGQVGKGGE